MHTVSITIVFVFTSLAVCNDNTCSAILDFALSRTTRSSNT